MTKNLIALTIVLLGISVVRGQEPGDLSRIRLYQIFGANAGVRALDEGFNNRVVRGKPFSATEERRSLQVLGDGTRIETNQTNRVFRDSEGRTRAEEMNGTATIFDPMTNRRVELNPTARTARNVINLPALTAYRTTVQGILGNTQGVTAETTENLNPQMVNGVVAQGVRTTMTIPKGQIGNDREIKVVTERWTSNDLQMLIKSTNSDPRFGDTSYQLTGIVEREQDASLFQIPAGYTEIGGGAGGRGGAVGINPAPPAGGGRSATKGGGRSQFGDAVPAPAGGRGGRGGAPASPPEPAK